MKKRDVACVKPLLAMIVCIGAPSAQAWMKEWAPKFDAPPAKVHDIPERSIRNYAVSVDVDDGERARPDWSEGGRLDLNGDGIDDFVFIIPWLGCGLAAYGFDAHFIVSDGHGGRVRNAMAGYDMELSDLVCVKGKVYFRRSIHTGCFEKSQHNHWVYQVFSFGTDGYMKCADSDFGKKFPAVTIYYINPKFKQIELTKSDLIEIQKETGIFSSRYVP